MNTVKIGKYWAEILLFGSLWGVSEVIIENYLVPMCVIPRSIILSTMAIFLISIARTQMPQPGLIFITGVVAALYKFLNIQFFGCQILALIMLSGSFEIVHNWRLTRKMNTGLRGLLTILLFNVSFALVASYILRNSWWVDDGVSKIIRFIFIEGGITAVLAFGVCLLGEELGKRLLRRQIVWTGPAIRSYHFISLLFACSAIIIMSVL